MVSGVAATSTISTKVLRTTTKLFVAVVTFSINRNTKYLENMKEGFKRIAFKTKKQLQKNIK